MCLTSLSGHKTQWISNTFQLKTEITKTTKAAATGVSQRWQVSLNTAGCFWQLLPEVPQCFVCIPIRCSLRSGSLQGLLAKLIEWGNFQSHFFCVLHQSLLKSSDRAFHHLLFCAIQKQVPFAMWVVLQPTTKGNFFWDATAINPCFYNTAL